MEQFPTRSLSKVIASFYDQALFLDGPFLLRGSNKLSMDRDGIAAVFGRISSTSNWYLHRSRKAIINTIPSDISKTKIDRHYVICDARITFWRISLFLVLRNNDMIKFLFIALK